MSSFDAAEHILFGTDFEGGMQNFLRYLQVAQRANLPCVRLTHRSAPLPSLDAPDSAWVDPDFELRVDPGCHWVLGGDTPDHGTHDLTLIRWFVELKRRDPDSVTLLVGNRDCDKIRLYQELRSVRCMDRLYAVTSGDKPEEPYWKAQNKRIGLKKYIEEYLPEELLQEIEPNQSRQTIADGFRNLSFRTKQHLYLYWMLGQSMGAPQAYLRRKDELAWMRGRAVSYDEVLTSFLEESEPGTGLYWQYLSLGEVMVRREGILWIHGAVTIDSYIAVFIAGKQWQWLPSSIHGCSLAHWQSLDARERQKMRNNFLDHWSSKPSLEEMTNALQNEVKSQYTHHLKSEWTLLENVHPTLTVPLINRGYLNMACSLENSGLPISNDWNRHGDTPLDRRHTDFMIRAGIHTQIMGHIPQGNTPRVLSQQVYPAKNVVFRLAWADTTHKDAHSGTPNVESIRVQFDSRHIHLRIHEENECRVYPPMSTGGSVELEYANLIGLGYQYLPESLLMQYLPAEDVSDFTVHTPWSVDCLADEVLYRQKHGHYHQFKFYSFKKIISD